MTDFLTFGEVMLRPKSPAHQRLFQPQPWRQPLVATQPTLRLRPPTRV